MSILKCGLRIEAVNVGLRPYEMSERGAHRHGNRRAVPSFAKARASGRRIAAAHVEHGSTSSALAPCRVAPGVGPPHARGGRVSARADSE